jgi:hypothetical protein
MKLVSFVRATIPSLLCAMSVAAQANNPVAFRQLARLIASDGHANDYMGYSTAISGDTLVVGAPQNASVNAGKAYVFVKPSTGWANATQTAELTPSDGVPGLFFGWRVAISGNTIVVDAGSYDGSEMQAVYVFVKPEGGWTNMTETAKLTLTNGNYLYTVAISGNTIAAAAPEENGYQGAVYIFEKPSGGWRTGLKPRAMLTALGGSSFLGFALGLSGNTLVATSINHAAYVFVRPSSGWVNTTQTAELTASNETGTDEFGDSVAINGKTIVVGAPESGLGRDYYGAAYLYYEPSSGWSNATENAEIMASNFAAGSYFGASVAVSGSLTAIGANGSNEDEGAAYIFAAGTQVAELTSYPETQLEGLGWSGAADGETVFSGAVYATVGNNFEQGAVFVFAH